jgi:hypothetical protein
VVAADLAQGMKIDAILLGTPLCYATSYATLSLEPLLAPHGSFATLSGGYNSPPTGLYSPTFTGNADQLSPGALPNPQNYWAMFVYTAVARYHGRIQNWEIWNEPDLNQFWVGSVTDYARLLKVAYLAAHAADNSVKILVGGMDYWQWANQSGDQAWLKAFLPIVTGDPTAAPNNFYFDVIPLHLYSRSSDVYNKALSAQAVLASYGLGGKELWLNETNVPACNETLYDPNTLAPSVPNPCAIPSNGAPPGFGSINEQASFIIQAVAYAFAAGMTKVFEFQFQDDGVGQAFGLYRNNGSVRPVYAAYQLTVQFLENFSTVSRSAVGGAEAIGFGVPGGPAPHRTTVLWNDTGQPVTVAVPALGVPPISVSLVQQDGSQQSLAAAATYSFSLPAATDNRNYDSPWNQNDYVVGGSTAFLVEYAPSDTTPPVGYVNSATYNATSQTAQIGWVGCDPQGWGVLDFSVSYRDATTAGPWTSWLANVAGTSATLAVIPNHTYQFRAVARDWAGNVQPKLSDQIDWILTASATTPSAAAPETSTLTHVLLFPLVFGPPCP